MATSYNGWPASSSPSAIGIVHFEPVPGHDFPAGIKGGDVKTVFTYLVQQLHKRVEPIVIYPPGDEWGYAYRANVNNPSVLSCHASGTAIDYNATEHPNRVAYTWTREQAREIHQIIDEELNGVIKWLEGYDEMHFEVRGSASAVAAVAKKIKAMATTPPTPPPNELPEEEMPAIYVYWKDNRKAGTNYTRYMDVSEKPVVPGVHVYGLVNGLAIYQGPESLAVADFLNGAAPLNKIGSTTKPVTIITAEGKADGWFVGSHCVDGPLKGIKK
jgi:hypothetical protein